MKISTIAIKKQEFGKSTRGYNTKEVAVFLETLADDIDLIQQENDALKKQLEQVSAELEEYKGREESLNEKLLKAQEVASHKVENAEMKGSSIVRDAEGQARQIVETARQKAKEIKSTVIELREERNLIVAKLKAIINSQARLLDLKIADEDNEVLSSTWSDEEKIKLEQKENVSINIEKIAERLSTLS